MPHLVADFYDTPIEKAILGLTEAHDYLAECAKQTLPRLQAVDSSSGQGTTWSRSLPTVQDLT